ncbi:MULTISPECIES: flavodoxin [unclassified Desulfovibrio]|uniref:flavodoxin n=1 Tax=unclassified Desulfovibrio TaxID=2593640 RepID=UPI002FDAF10C
MKLLLYGLLLLGCVTVPGMVPGKVLAAEAGKPKVLVVFYSKSGNTEAVARMIQAKTGGDIYKIETVKTYTRERPAAADIPKEELETGNLPELKGEFPDISRYDVVIIGSPIWWYTAATPVMTFLRDIDFQGKTVAGFYTYAGDGRRFDGDLRNRAKNARVMESIGFRGTYDNGRGEEPDGRAYQEERKEAVGRQLDAWLGKIL